MINQAGNENTTVRKTCDLPIIQVGRDESLSPKGRDLRNGVYRCHKCG